MTSSMKSNHNIRTHRGTGDSSEHSRSYSFPQPYPGPKCEVKQTKKVTPCKSPERNIRNPKPGINRESDEVDNELVKYMSNLPGFLQHMEKKSNVQDKALNFGVLDWKRLEKWKYTERMPRKIAQESKNQSSASHVRNPSPSLRSGKQTVPYGSRFFSPQRRNGEQNYEFNRNEIFNRDHRHRRVEFPDEKNVYKRERKDTKDERVSEKEASGCNSSDPESVVLLTPKHFPKNGSESSLDEQLAEITGPRLSDFFCPQEFRSGEFSSCGAVGSIDSLTSRSVDLDVRPSAPESKCSVSHERASSPARRFNFHHGRMSRSLSCKDKTGLPQLSSTYTGAKSGPIRPEISSGPIRAKSSPLRRLLDPLLKHRGPQTAAETVSVGTKTHSRNTKPDGPTLQALLQITLKNGLPSFKLVVDNSNDMLAAAVTRLPISGKSDTRMAYAFYSVHEIGQKSTNWMNQGSKGKSFGLGYNIVGEMKISGSDECDSRECVLYGVDPGRVSEERTLEYVPNKEIAAVIVRNSSKMTNVGEDRNSSGIVVILPGGVHATPAEGTPSSLVSRWRFGGLCDCGGWDVGCKLRILTEERRSSNGVRESDSSSAIDQVDLYVEGGEKGKKPVFILKPFSNGYYSVELDASISLLEAFSTCVAYITFLKFPEIVDAKNPSGPEHFTEAIFQEQLPAYVTCPPVSPAGRI